MAHEGSQWGAIPPEIVRRISSYLIYSDIRNFAGVCKDFYATPFLGADTRSILIVFAVDTTGSMDECFTNLKPALIKTMLRAKAEYPNHIIRISIVEYGDIDDCFTPSYTYVEGKPRIADIIYNSHHFLRIQCPLKHWGKIYNMVNSMKLMGGGGSEAFDYAIVRICEEFDEFWNGDPFSESVDFLIIVQDIVGHNMGNDGSQLFHQIYDKHGLNSDWFAALKELSNKNVIVVHLALNTNTNPATLRHFGKICTALGGYSLNIMAANIFEIPDLVMRVMSRELAFRSLAHAKYESAVGECESIGITARRDVMRALAANRSQMELGIDPRILNKFSAEVSARVRACETLKDLHAAGLMISPETSMYLIRRHGGSVDIVGNVDTRGSHELCSHQDPPDFFNAPGLTRQMTCVAPQAACAGPPHLPEHPPAPSLIRSDTVWGPVVSNVFAGTPYLPMTLDEQVLFEPSPTPDPSRILVGLSKPTQIYTPTLLETQMGFAPMDAALAMLLADQPSQSSIIHAASFNNYCIGLEQNFLSQCRDQSEIDLLSSAARLSSSAIEVPDILTPTLVSSRSIFADPN
jgi:hypothetical protein